MYAFFRRIFTPAAPSQAVQDKPTAKPPRAPKPKRPPGTRGVKLPNGIVLYSTWYRPPRLDGRMSGKQVQAMDAAYRRWYRDTHGRPYAG